MNSSIINDAAKNKKNVTYEGINRKRAPKTKEMHYAMS